MNDFLKEIKELIALLHWLSNVISLLTAISERGVTEGTVFWLVSGFILAIISELIETHIPSYLRPIFKHLFGGS